MPRHAMTCGAVAFWSASALSGGRPPRGGGGRRAPPWPASPLLSPLASRTFPGDAFIARRQGPSAAAASSSARLRAPPPRSRPLRSRPLRSRPLRSRSCPLSLPSLSPLPSRPRSPPATALQGAAGAGRWGSRAEGTTWGQGARQRRGLAAAFPGGRHAGPRPAAARNDSAAGARGTGRRRLLLRGPRCLLLRRRGRRFDDADADSRSFVRSRSTASVGSPPHHRPAPAPPNGRPSRRPRPPRGPRDAPWAAPCGPRRFPWPHRGPRTLPRPHPYAVGQRSNSAPRAPGGREFPTRGRPLPPPRAAFEAAGQEIRAVSLRAPRSSAARRCERVFQPAPRCPRTCGRSGRVGHRPSRRR